MDESNIIGNDKTSKYIIYTADGTEFHLQEFYEGTASGKFENGDMIRFHPENIIAIRIKSINTI